MLPQPVGVNDRRQLMCAMQEGTTPTRRDVLGSKFTGISAVVMRVAGQHQRDLDGLACVFGNPRSVAQGAIGIGFLLRSIPSGLSAAQDDVSVVRHFLRHSHEIVSLRLIHIGDKSISIPQTQN